MVQRNNPEHTNTPRSNEDQIEELQRKLAEAEATLNALLSGEIDAVVDRETGTPVLLAAAQQALRESERRFRAIFDGAMDAMLIADDDGRYLDANPAACEMFGVSREALLGHTAADFAPPDFDFNKAWESFRQGQQERGEFRILRPDGSERVAEYSATTNILPGQHLSVMRDVTARKRLEREREMARHQLQERVKEANLLLDVGRVLSLAFSAPLPEALAAVVQLLPAGWQYSEITAARIIHDDDVYATPNFVVTPWLQPVSLSLPKDGRLTIEVVYLEERPEADEGPFLKEERQTLELLARMLQSDLERRLNSKALRESESYFRYLFENNPRPMWVHDQETGAILQVNEVAVAKYGYSRTEFQQMTIDQIRLGPPAGARVVHDATSSHLSNERQHKLKDGRVIDVEVSSRPMEYDNRPAILKVAWDITARKQQEREMSAIANIAHNLRTAQTLAEMLPAFLDEMMALFLTDSAAIALNDTSSNEFTIERVHGQWQELAGQRFRPGEGITGRVIASGQSFITDDLGSEPEYLSLGALDQRYAAACIPLRAEQQAVGALWLVRRSGFTQAEVQLLTAVSDIVANALLRATFYERLQAQALQMQRVMTTVNDGLILLDQDQRVLLANPAAAGYLPVLLDHSQPEIEGLIGLKLTQLGGIALQSFLALDEDSAVSYLTVKETKEREFELMAHALDSKSVGNGWVLVVRDVTEERRAETQRQQQDRLAAVGRLAAGIAHDFNNAMNTIGIYAELLQRSATTLSDKEQKYLRIIDSQIHHAADLISQILDFSRSSVMERKPLNLVSFFKELMKLWQRTLPENIELQFQYDRPDCVINADPSRLQQAFMNLVINARDALPEGGELRFSLSEKMIADDKAPPVANMTPGAWCMITVVDTGTGIPANVLPRIFDPFFTTKPPNKGTGLGLSQVYGIVKQHEGHILVDSQSGVGTTFTVYLPLLADPVMEEYGLIHDMPLATANRNTTILLVEDDKHLREAIQEALAMVGYEVLATANGRYALEQITNHAGTIDLMISDLVMPEMGGVELYQKVRQDYPNVKVILITGYPLTDESRTLLNQGEVERLQKPFTIAALVNKVQHILEEDATN